MNDESVYKSCLLLMYNKETGAKERVYSIQNDNNGYPLFLIRVDGRWTYRSAKHYITREERLVTPYVEFERICGIDAKLI